MTEITPEMGLDRLRQLLTGAVWGLDPRDRAERIAWCRRTGQHGIEAQLAEDGTEFHWGGRLLAVIPPDVLTADTDAVVGVVRMPGVPDDVSALTGDPDR